MQAVAHNESFARMAGIPKHVGEKFTDADKAMGKFQKKKGKK